MTVRRFEWSLVRTFLAVLDTGSVMAAARKLGAQQPTLSRQLAELESQLGAPLFERTGRGVFPTVAARAITEAAREMGAGAERLAHALDRASVAPTGTVRLTTTHVAASYLLPPVLAAFRAEEPTISLELFASDRLTNLLQREADVAVRMARPSQSSLITRKLGDLEVVACAHESYLERAGWPESQSDLAAHTLIGFDADKAILRGFAAKRIPITREDFAIRTDDTIAYGRLVAAGAGIGFLTAFALPYLPGVVPVLPSLRIPPIPCWLAVHREMRSNRIVKRLYDFLAHAVPRELGRHDSRVS